MADSAIIDDLYRLLEEERTYLRAGRLQELAALLPRKEALSEQIGQAVLDGDGAGRLREALARNQALLDAARTGIEEMGARLGAIDRLRCTLGTYDRDGRRAEAGTAAGTRMEKRA